MKNEPKMWAIIHFEESKPGEESCFLDWTGFDEKLARRKVLEFEKEAGRTTPYYVMEED